MACCTYTRKYVEEKATVKEKRRHSDDSEVIALHLKKAKTRDLIDSVLCNEIETVGYYLEDADINPAEENNLALRCACENGYVQMVKLLLTDSRVDPMQETENIDDNEDVINPLILACQYGHKEIVKLLIADPRVNPDEYRRAIQNAIISGFAEIVELLLKDPRIDPTKGDLLFLAVQEGYVEIVKLLLADWRIRLSLNISNLSKNEESNLCALSKLAAQYDHIDVLEVLLSQTVNQEAESNSQYHQIKNAMNCNKFGLFSNVVTKNNLDSKLCSLVVKNLAEEIGNAHNIAIKK